MNYFINKRLKIIICIIVSFFISSLANNNLLYGKKPVLNTLKLAGLRSDITKFVSENIKSVGLLDTIKKDSNKFVGQQTGYIEGQVGNTSEKSGYTKPTSLPLSPVKKIIIPTKFNTIYPTRVAPSYNGLSPTSKQKPTMVSEPTPTPVALPQYMRPGKNLEEIFSIASKISCVSVPLIKAIVRAESPGVLTYSERSALFYNAFDWWHRVDNYKQVCSGYGYYTQTGLIAEDSLFAGQKCKEPYGQGPPVTIGTGQLLEREWTKYKDKVKSALSLKSDQKVDRRVTIDGLIAIGMLINEETRYKGSCDNWDFKYVIKAACVYGGYEQYSYFSLICRNYNQFTGGNNNCDNLEKMFQPKTCNFK